MHPIQEKLLQLSKRENLAKLTLREMAKKIGDESDSPQKIKHHLLQLQKKGFLSIDRARGVMDRTRPEPSWADGLLSSSASIFSIPIVGTANCGPATIFAEQNIEGFLRVSSRLVGRARPDNLYAVQADGASMNRAEVHGKRIDDGDFVIVDANRRDPRHGEVVVVIIDNRATIKRFLRDEPNEQIVLQADSSFDYEPIYLHEDDDFHVSGVAAAVIKAPSEDL